MFTNCSTAQRLQKSAPVSLGDVYCQKWVSGVQGGGSGLNLFIPGSKEMPQSIQLDSVYFRGKGTKLEKVQLDNVMYVGRFDNDFNQKKDIVMSHDSEEEYGNQAPLLDTKIPFDLKNSECVVSYKEGTETKYFKIENITQKQPEHFPNTKQNKP